MDLKNDHSDHELDSQPDEGFVPSKIVIIEENLQAAKLLQQIAINPKKQFHARFISEGIMRKQPPQCYQRFQKFDYVDSIVPISKAEEQDIANSMNKNASMQSSSMLNQSAPKIKSKSKSITPYDKFIGSGNYSLIYSRYRDFSFNNQQQNFAKNQVKLDCLTSLDDINYKQVKPFQLTDDMAKQNMGRTNFKEKVLHFDSKFQCGNLLCAFKHKQQSYTYSLFMQNDTNSYGYNQWFYFSIRNAEKGSKYKFNIVNFRKRHSFFREGNRPVIFSLIDSKSPNFSGYSKRAEKLKYGKSDIVKSYTSRQKFFQLSFQLQFYNDNDIYFVSMGLPYSYSKMINSLNTFEAIAKQNKINFQLDSIGVSIAGNQVPYVTISKCPQDTIQQQALTKQEIKQNDQQTPSQQQQQKIDSQKIIGQQQKQQLPKQQITQKNTDIKPTTTSKKKRRQKKVIFLLARQHPGQTWSSYLMDQFIYGLVNKSNPEADYILQNFIIKCIPMVNVDGVINGNFRCDLSGMDLNRNWKNASSILHPQIVAIKNQLTNMVNDGYKVECCFDLHGHSKQYNVFCYSCKTDNYQCRLLPYIFSELNEKFYFPFCTFGISKYKMHTARAVIFNIIKNTNVLTIQSSFLGSKINQKRQIFEPFHFKNMAQTLIKCCKSYFIQDQLERACKQTIKMRISQFLQYRNQVDGGAVSGSDSEPSGDEMDAAQKFEKILPKALIKECMQLQKSKKSSKKIKKISKKNSFNIKQDKSKSKKTSFFSQGKHRTIDVIKQQSPHPEKRNSVTKYRSIRPEQNKTTISNFRPSNLSQQLMMQQNTHNSSKKVYMKDLVERQDSKLPYFTKQKPQMIPLKLKNQSFEIFRDAYNATEKHLRPNLQTDQSKNKRRTTSKKLGIYKQRPQKQQQFPLLCVLSQNKKKTHVQKFKQRNDKRKKDHLDPNISPEKIRTVIQTRTQAIKQLRDKNKNSMQLVSKIWRDNFTRYGMAFSTFKIAK